MGIEAPRSLAEQVEREGHLARLHTEARNHATLRENIFAQMKASRGEKYRWFLRGIAVLKHITDTPEQAEVIENFYVAMRYVDDLVDGDVKLPQGYTGPTQYVEEKINFLEANRPPKDDIEKLMALCIQLGTEFEHDYREDAKDILNCLFFDAKRRGKHEVFDEKTLHDHFYLLDIKGTIKGALEVVGEKPELYKVLEPLGEAVRIYYNLRDFNSDIAAGYINISREDCKRLDIPKHLLAAGSYRHHPGVRAWFLEQAQKGLALIEEYHRRKKDVTFGPATSATLKVGYEFNAKRFLKAVAGGDFDKILDRA